MGTIDGPYRQLVKVISIGSVANRILKEGRIGVVHSVFERTFNVMTLSGNLISFVRSDVYRGPINIVVDLPSSVSMPSLGVVRGVEVERVKDFIVLGDGVVTFSLDHAEVWRAQRQSNEVLSIKQIQDNLSVARRVFDKHGSRDGVGQLIDHLDNIMSKEDIVHPHFNRVAQVTLPRIRQLIRAVKQRDMCNVKDATKSLVGLGLGLTPSADDMLAGFMAASVMIADRFGRSFDHVSKVNRAIVEVVEGGGTTVLSQELMRHASMGEVAEPIVDLLEALITSDAEDVARCTKKVLTIGETSGADTLLGVLLSLHMQLMVMY